MEPIKLSYDVPVPQERAFALFVEDFATWWPAGPGFEPAGVEGASLEPRVGGDVSWTAGDRTQAWGRVEAFDDGARVEWSCWWMGEADEPSLVSVSFAENDWGCRVTFEHGGWNEQNGDWRASYGRWPLVLSHYVMHARRASLDPLVDEDSRGVA